MDYGRPSEMVNCRGKAPLFHIGSFVFCRVLYPTVSLLESLSAFAKERNVMNKTLKESSKATIEIKVVSRELSFTLKTNLLWLAASIAAISQLIYKILETAH